MKAKMDKFTRELLKKSMFFQNSSSVLQSFYPLAVFGQICGFFPLQNILSGISSIKNLKFHLVSYPVIYAIVINFTFYALTFEASWDYWKERRNIFKFSTDAFAIQIFLAVFLFLRFALHLLCIFRAPKVLECLKQLETYDTFYNLENKTTFLNKYLAIYLIGTTVNIVGNVTASFPGVLRAVNKNFKADGTSRYLIYLIIPNPKFLAIFAYGIHVLAEAALFFAHCCITFIITGICDRVSEITTEILEISKYEKYSFLRTPKSETEEANHDGQAINLWINQIHSFPLIDRYQNHKYGLGESILDDERFMRKQENMAMKKNEHESTEKLKTLCSQYTSLVSMSRLLNNITKETVAVFTAGSAVMLVALFYLICILLTQYVPVRYTRIKESGEIVPLIFIALITFLRLLNFINIGEKMRCDGHELQVAIHRLYSYDSEAASVITYFQQVTATLHLNLCAGGFFIVRRTVITSILGPVLTFIVILAQFRAADLQLHYNSNGTASV